MKYSTAMLVSLGVLWASSSFSQVFKPEKIYKYQNIKAQSLSQVLSQIEQTAPYLGEDPQTLGSPYAAPNSSQVDGEPNQYYVDRFLSDGTQASPIGIDVGYICPPGTNLVIAALSSGSGYYTACNTINTASSGTCVANPIDIGAGKKIEKEVDYSSANGLLNVTRTYLGQYEGWFIEPVERLSGNLAALLLNEAAPEENENERDINGGIRSYPNPVLVELSDVESAVFSRYKKWLRPKFVGVSQANAGHPVAMLGLWAGNKFESFNVPDDVKVSFANGNANLTIGQEFYSSHKAGKRRKLIYTGSSSYGSHWQLVDQNSNIWYFSESGYLLRIGFVDGGSITYSYSQAPWYITTKTDNTGRQLSYQYDDHGRLVSVLLPSQETISYQYVSDNPSDDSFILLKKVSWPNGKNISYSYNESVYTMGQNLPLALTGKFDSYGTRIGTYYYKNKKAYKTLGADGVNFAQVDSLGATTTRITDGKGAITTYYFKELASGELVANRKYQPAGSGCSASQDYKTVNDEGLTVRYKNFVGYTTQYLYDDYDREIARIEGIPKNDTNDYFSSNSPLPEGARKISTQRLPSGLPIAIAEPLLKTTIVYHGNFNPFSGETESCIDGIGSSELTLPCLKVLEATTDQNGAQDFAAPKDLTAEAIYYRMHYNNVGQLASYGESYDIDASGTVQYRNTVLEYYADTTENWNQGDLNSITNSLGQSISFSSYNKDGQPLQFVTEDGLETHISYDPNGNRLAETQMYGGIALSTTRYAYDQNDLLEKLTLPSGLVLNYHYDYAQRLTGISNNLGERLAYTYDVNGNLTQINILNSDGISLYSKTIEYDNLNRMEAISNAQSLPNGRYFYDAQGNLTSTVNGKNGTYSWSYDSLGRTLSNNDPNNFITRYTYDLADHITSVTDANGNTTSYEYNGLGNLVQLISPDTGVTTFTYDSRGNVLTRTDANGVVTQYQYDALNRLTNMVYPSASTENVTYTYDDNTSGNFGIGRLTGISDASGNIHLRYNQLGLIETKTYDIAGQSYSLQYSYDSAGQLIAMTYPSGRTISYGYNSLGEIDSITTQANGGASQTIASNISYMPFGPLSSLVYGNGVAQTFTHDLDYRVTGISTSGPYAVINRAYSYDPNSNIDQITDNLSAINELFSYDPLDRLNGADGNYGSLQFNYDAIGNRLQKILTQGASTLTENYNYASTSQHLNSIDINDNGTASTRLFSYDDAGNLILDDHAGSATTIQYNNANRPASATSSGHNISYVHNSLGQRTIKTVNGVTRHYHYDEAGQLIAVSDASGNAVEEFIYLGNMVVAHYYAANDEVYFAHNDHLNTVKALTDATGEIVWKVVSQTPFGQVITDNDPDGDSQDIVFNLRFPGQYWDEETQSSYNYYRTYDPSLGRYIQSDPIGLAGGINTYAYVGGNPIMYFDPFGLCACGSGGNLNNALVALNQSAQQNQGLGCSVTSRNIYRNLFGNNAIGTGHPFTSTLPPAGTTNTKLVNQLQSLGYAGSTKNIGANGSLATPIQNMTSFSSSPAAYIQNTGNGIYNVGLANGGHSMTLSYQNGVFTLYDQGTWRAGTFFSDSTFDAHLLNAAQTLNPNFVANGQSAVTNITQLCLCAMPSANP